MSKFSAGIEVAAALASQGGLSVRQIAEMLEHRVEMWRQNDAMMRPVI